MVWMSKGRSTAAGTAQRHAGWAALLTILLAGATPSRAVEAPDNVPARLRLLQVGLTGAQVDIYLRAENGAGNTASIANLKMTAEVDGKPLPLRFVRDDGGTAIVLLIDVSRSTQRSFDWTKGMAMQLVRQIGATDQIAIVTMGSRVTLVSRFTRDQGGLIAALDGLSANSPESNLYAGLLRANGVANLPDPQLPQRRLVIAFTDGVAERGESAVGIADALAKQPVPVYGVLTTSTSQGDTSAWTSLVTSSQGTVIPYRPSDPDAVLQRLTGLIEASFHFRGDCVACPKDGSRMAVRVQTRTQDANLVSAKLSVAAPVP